MAADGCAGRARRRRHRRRRPRRGAARQAVTRTIAGKASRAPSTASWPSTSGRPSTSTCRHVPGGRSTDESSGPLDGARHDRHEPRRAVDRRAGERQQLVGCGQRGVAVGGVDQRQQPGQRHRPRRHWLRLGPGPPAVRRRRPLDERVERGVVGRDPVVGVDEQVAERLGALVHVDHTGRGDAGDEQRQRDRPTGTVQRGGQVAERIPRDEHAGQPAEGGLVRLGGRRPRGVQVGLPRRLDEEVAQAARHPGRPSWPPSAGPATASPDRRRAARAGTGAPGLDDRVPAVGHRGERQAGGAHVLAAGDVVGRAGQQRARPRRHRVGVVGVGHGDRVHRRIGLDAAADLGQRRQRHVAPEGTVLDALGGGRTGQLLPAVAPLARLVERRGQALDQGRLLGPVLDRRRRRLPPGPGGPPGRGGRCGSARGAR